MKIYAYLAAFWGLPFVLLADDEEAKKANPASDESAEAVEAVTDSGFERFKTILDRMPFGRPPPGFNPDSPGGSGDGRRDSAAGAEAAAAAEASEVEQQIVSSVKVSLLNRTGDGRVFVGFTDSSVQPAKNYLLELGEKREKCEWQVVGADPDNREVTLSKGGVEATLKVGGGGGAPGDKDGKAKNAEGGAKPGMPSPGIVRSRLQMASSGADSEEGGDRKLSGLEIARARRQRNLEMQQAEMEQRRQAAEQAQKEREQEKRDREMAAAERKEQRALLMQLGEEIQRQREEREQRQAETEGATPQGGAQEPVTE